jgi:transcriptional regulator with AAA-type ATPase domain/tetratricopeptide (TPR) repeat protein
VGTSKAIQEINRQIARSAPRSSTVLLLGETGTGKELVARAIHYHKDSPRRTQKFCACNCAAFAESLLENELFGHERGAYTSAQQRSKGLFEQADHGTLFLDEIGETSLTMQARLLRVLQEREFKRLGGEETVHVDVRIIAATNGDLQQLVQKGKFRKDLYFRLNATRIELPSLRERKEDIPLLLEHFLRVYGQENGREGLRFSSEAMKTLQNHSWPGNVRELEYAVQRAIDSAADTDTVLLPPPRLDDLNEEVRDHQPPGISPSCREIEELARALDERQRKIFDAGTKSQFVLRRAATLLHETGVLKGGTRQALWKLLNEPYNAELRDAWIEGKNLLKRRPVDKGKYDLTKGEAEVGYAQGLKTGGAIDPVLRAVHQFPRLTRDFTGRKAEIEELRAIAADKGGAVLCGMAGIGKTELALRVAKELTKNDPEMHQFYIDLKGASPRPLTVADAMAHVILSFYPLASLGGLLERRGRQWTEAELRAWYHSVLYKKRAILLLDNAKDEAQVEPLSDEACVLLVTSRQHLVLRGLETKELGALLRPDACALLLAIEPRIEGEANAIAELCADLPLALRAAASTFKKRPNVSPADYARQLKSDRARLELTEPSRNASIEAVLDLSYKLLGSEEQDRLRSLGVFPGEFEAEGAAAVWDCTRPAAERSLNTLWDRSLVEHNDAAARYRLHDLVQLFAYKHLTRGECVAAQRRHAEHYKQVAARSRDLYISGGDHAKNGLDLWDLEWENIRAGQAWAADHASEDDTAAQLCSDYVEAGEWCLELRRLPFERVSWGEAGLAAAQRLSRRGLVKRDAEGWHHDFLGFAYSELGEPGKAREHHERELAIARDIPNRCMEGHALNGLGFDAEHEDDADSAIDFYKKALATFDEVLGDLEHGDNHIGTAFVAQLGKGYVLGNLGVAQMKKRDFAGAIDCHGKAIESDRKIGYRRGEAEGLGDLGRAYTASGNPRQAIEHHEKALVIDSELGDLRTEGEDRRGLGDAYVALGEFQAAIEQYRTAIDIDSKWGDRACEGTDHWKLAKAFYEAGNRFEAIANAERAVRIFEEATKPLDAEEVRTQLARWQRREES